MRQEEAFSADTGAVWVVLAAAHPVDSAALAGAAAVLVAVVPQEAGKKNADTKNIGATLSHGG